MRDALAFGVVAVVLTALAVVLTQYRRDFPETTPRLLASDPDFWDGRSVKLRTAGMESAGGELRFRFSTDQPYRVVVTFKSGKVPEPVPAHVSGVCKTDRGVVTLSAR